MVRQRRPSKSDAPPQAGGASGSRAKESVSPHLFERRSESDLINVAYDGNESIYRRFVSDVAQQIALDLHEGDSACGERDRVRLVHVAHNAKVLLPMLGYDAAGELAGQMERAGMAGNLEECGFAWKSLREVLQAVLDNKH